MNWDLSWQALGAIAGMLVVLAGIALSLIRSNLKTSFVDIGTHNELVVRVTSVESRIIGSPTHDDLRALSAKLSGMVASMAGTTATLIGLGQSVSRVERMTELLLKNELDHEHPK